MASLGLRVTVVFVVNEIDIVVGGRRGRATVRDDAKGEKEEDDVDVELHLRWRSSTTTSMLTQM